MLVSGPGRASVCKTGPSVLRGLVDRRFVGVQLPPAATAAANQLVAVYNTTAGGRRLRDCLQWNTHDVETLRQFWLSGSDCDDVVVASAPARRGILDRLRCRRGCSSIH